MNFNLALPPNELFEVAELHRKYQLYKLTASISEYVSDAPETARLSFLHPDV